MNYILFIIFSTIESFSIVFLGLILFRHRINQYKIRDAAIIGLILACLSLLLNILKLEDISPFIQMIGMCVLFMRYYKTRIVHTILSCITPYLLFGLIQAVFMFILDYFNVIKFKDMVPFTFKGYSIQFFSFVLVLLVAFVIRMTNEGYSFVPDEPTRKVKRFTNQIIIIVICLAVTLVSGFFYEFKQFQVAYDFIPLFVVIIISTCAILFVNLKRDEEESS